MKVLIKNIKGDFFELDLEPSSTISEAKLRIKQLKNIVPECQKLIFKGVVTSNEKSLADCGIKDSDFLVLMTTKAAPSKPASQPEKPLIPVHPEESTENRSSSGLVFGEALEKAIESMVAMGFNKPDVIRALHAAYNNPDKALDYLFNGIPDIFIMEQQLHTHSEAQRTQGLVANNNEPSSDQSAIERLCSLGFEREAATRAYYASGKNENMAANILLYSNDNENMQEEENSGGEENY